MAVGNSKDTSNKIFIFDYASAINISDEYLPKSDLTLFGLILMNLNGVEFSNNINGAELEGIANIIDSLLKEWNEDYAKVNQI